MMRKYILIMLGCIIYLGCLGQVKESNVELRVRNDDAGEISNWLHSGDDLGETQSLMVAVNILKKHSKYNYRFKVESTEYSALYKATPEPRDILFRELNNFQIILDNNKFKKGSFLSVSPGLYYIQGNRITAGATGQKYYWHQWVVVPFYKEKYWTYINSFRDIYIPYVELKYGYNKLIIDKENISLNTITNAECRVASNINFSGVGARTYLDLKLMKHKPKFNMDFEMEGFYMTDFERYQTSFVQFGTRFNFKSFSIYTQINKPLQKYLANPLIKYDDKEILFNYGLIFRFKDKGK